MFKERAKRVSIPLWILCMGLPVFIACQDERLGSKFLDGARRQEGLDNGVVYLWRRSPAEDSGRLNILSSDRLDNNVPKTGLQLTNILDPMAPIRSRDFFIQYADFDAGAPMFFSWAGRYVPWATRTQDFRSLFAYYHVNRLVGYVDGLIDRGYLPPDNAGGGYALENTIAWRSSVCKSGATQSNGGKSCSDLNKLVGGPVLPFYVAVNNSTLPGGEEAFVADTGFCSMFNVDYRSNSQGYCLSRDSYPDWPTLWNNGSLKRYLSFFKDSRESTLNVVDDADAIAHEFGHLVQAAVNPIVLEMSSGLNRHVDAILEGISDYFAAAYMRSDSIHRYTLHNIYPLYPEFYSGNLRGTARDPANSLYFPDAYIPKAHDLGRVLSGAFNDIRKLGLHKGSGIARLPGGACAKVTGCSLSDFADRDEDPAERIPFGSVAVSEETAWDLSLALMFRALYALRQLDADEAMAVTMHKFASIVVEQCAAWTDCENTFGSTNVRSILQDRGLLSTRHFDMSTSLANQDISAISVKHLGEIGMVGVPGHIDSAQDNILRRWGVIASTQLAWIPYRPGNSNDFANTDSIPSPCETIIVFPNISNNSNDPAWGEAPPPLPGAGWPNYPAMIANWIPNGNPNNFNPLTRGVDIVELFYKMHETPTNFENFWHPVLGYIEPFTGAENAEWKSIPYLQAGENTQAVAANMNSRIYGNYQERFFDKSLANKTVSTSSSLSSLRSQVGYILKLPKTVGTKASMKFKISYRIANTKEVTAVTQVKYIDHNNAAKPIASRPFFEQSIEVQAGPSFCKN